MNDYDYIVLIDENGQPYIEHSIKDRFKAAGAKVSSGVKRAGKGMGRGWRASTKYLLKVGEGAKAKYAYTQAEVDALLGRGRKAVSGAADAVKRGVAGVKSASSDAIKSGKDALKTGSSKVKEYSERTSEALKRHGSETLKSIKDAADKAPDSIKDKVSDAYDSAKERVKDVLGYDEKERYEKAKDKYTSAIEKERELAAKKYPIQRSFFDFDTEMFEKYGRTSDYKEKMTNAEREKYDKLEKELTDISEEHWTAFKDTMWAAARQPETARDIYDKAFSEYMATPIARLDELKRKIKKK